MVYPRPVQAALESDDAVDLCAIYGVRPEGSDTTVTVAAVTIRPGRELTADRIRRALSPVDGTSWPTAIRVLERMPRSAHYRVHTAPLRAEGLPEDMVGWVWD